MLFSFRFLVWVMFVPFSLIAQTPTGTIFGTVFDPSGAVVPQSKITVINKNTGAVRVSESTPAGTYTAAALTAGQYEVRVEHPGFALFIRPVLVGTGLNTLADLHVQFGAAKQEVTADGANPQMNYDTPGIEGLVNRRQIESLPLNGRSFLQLASLERGIAVTPGYAGSFNGQFDVSVLGGDALHTMITVDGGSVWDHTTGGTGMNFSQEVVQEFQISSANFDLSTGITGYGAINVVTRSGGNDLHGAAYLYYRDHNMAAYPGLVRNALAADPYFARRQPGFWLSGPLRKNRLFYFFNLEGNLQNSIYIVQPNSPRLSSFAEVAPSPFRGKQLSARFDYRLSDRNSLMVRYSHDGNRTTEPPSPQVVSPSNWLEKRNWSDQSLFALSTTFKPKLVNDFRFSFWYWSNRNLAISRPQCTATCVGYGLPEIQIIGTNFTIGSTHQAPQGRDSRRWSYNDALAWEHGRHRLRVGGEAVHDNVSGFWDLADPAVIAVYSPDLLEHLGLLGTYRLSAGLHTTEDILRLPLHSFFTGIGDSSQPQPYNRARARQNDRFHVFAQDTWRIKTDLTLSYGLAWSYENNLLNFDLTKPQFLAAVLGPGGLGAGDHNSKNFSPSLGFAWRVGRDNRTAVRAGAGIYYDTQLLWERAEERSYIGPFPNGHVIIDGESILNPVPGLAGAPVGQPIRYTDTPTGFTAGLLITLLLPIRAALSQAFGTSSSDLSLRTINISKSARHLLPKYFPTAYSEHLSAGIQRELAPGLVVSADFVFRQYMHTLFDTANAPDYNHFDAARGPVIPRCVGAQATDSAALCSTGPITVWTPGGRGNYKALLVKVDKRLRRRFEFTASYALASQRGFSASTGFANLDNWFANYGPLGSRQSLTLAGILNLPWNLQVSLISVMSSRPPVMPYIDQIDLSGSGASFSLLPGATFNCFNRGCGKSDLIRLVDQFNNTFAGKLTSRGQLIPKITLPSNLTLGDGFSAQDIRVSKVLRFAERLNISVFAELFNVLNIANRSAFNFDLNAPGFGQPTQRIGQAFGSGGPRALQVGARLSF